MNSLFASGDYGFYIICSYTCVILFLFAAWYLPWRNHKKQQLKLKHRGDNPK